MFAYYDMIQRNLSSILVLEDDAIISATPTELKEIISDGIIINTIFTLLSSSLLSNSTT
jgi:hypothetical protein